MRRTVLASAVWLLAAATAGASQMGDEQSRQEARQHYALGQEHMRSEKWDRAEAEFKQAIKLDPLFTLAHYSLGQVHMNTHTYPRAVLAFTGCQEAFRQAAALGAADKGVAEHQLDQEIRDLRDTVNAYISGSVKSSQPNNMVLKLESRIAELDRMRRRGTVSTEMPAEFSLALGSAYLRDGQFPQAEHQYLQAVKANPKMGEAHNNLAVVYMVSGRVDLAENEVKLAERAGFRVHPQLKKDIAGKDR